jgi:hypothetical protein
LLQFIWEVERVSRRLLAVFVMSMMLLLATACGGAEQAPTPEALPGDQGETALGPVSSFEDIAGTTYEYQGQSGTFYFHFFEDGTWNGARRQEAVIDNPAERWETTFDGTNILVTEIKGPCGDAPDPVYELHLLENGNLTFVAIGDDACPVRARSLSAEWAPVR